MNQDVIEKVQAYYGDELASNKDLKTTACCPLEGPPHYLKPLLSNIHDRVQEKFYGCGSPIPHDLSGLTVLDLGCGSGRDAYLLSQLVGPEGKVIGVDMTAEQLSVARYYQDWHAKAFGHAQSNVTFLDGMIEDLAAIGIEDDSIDVVVSNCVINLSSNKEAVFSEIFRVLKPGGELFFSDVFADRRISNALQTDKILLGECLSGALYTEDFRRMLQAVGVADCRTLTSRKLELEDPDIEQKAGMIGFYSQTIRAFKLALEDRCENYGQVAFYRGTLPNSPHQFLLDDHHVFKTGLPVPVCGNTASMLENTRYRDHFRVIGNQDVHYGLFDCNPSESSSEMLCC